MVNFVMFLFGVIQVLLTYVTYLDCQDQGNRFPGSPFYFICQQGDNDSWYWVPLLILIYVNVRPMKERLREEDSLLHSPKTQSFKFGFIC
jgi:hypothetical protein